jgi:D-3-phosphoglycerate dehydrogenase / 2-oxoglutarate reductase
MKILIADKLGSEAISALEAMGAIITSNPDLTAEEIPDVIADNEILIVRSTKVTSETIKKGSSLSLIIRAGAGVNTIDLETASRHGIHVANCPGKNSDAVAELAIGLLIAADRRIAFATVDLQQGKWNKKEYGKANGLKGRTLGVIGIGNIGKGVIRKAKGLEMNVIAWSRSLTPELAEELEIGYCASPLEIAAQADAISLHVAVKPETQHMVNAEFLSKMKDGAILINAARGEVVDTAALKDAIKNKGLRVALDVYENEPKGGIADFADTELASMTTCTPHIGASTNQSTEAIADEVVRIVSAYKTTGSPLNVVNMRSKSDAANNLVIRHFNRVGVLAKVLDALKDQDINIEEMQNSIFDGGEAATCTLKLDQKPADSLITDLNQSDDIIKAELN